MPISVKPSGNGWTVTKNGTTKSSHRKKRPAVSKARSLAGPRTQIRVHRADGTFQRVIG